MSNQLPYTISGTVYDTDGSTAVNGATVRARNETNNEIISITTDSSGQYIFDASNFASGYLLTDKITVYVIYTNLEASGTITIANNEHTKNLTLASIADSSLIYYCTVQDVFNEMDITETDLSSQRVIKAIQRAEARIDEKTHTKFTSTAVTEYYDFNQFSGSKSPEQLQNVGYVGRRDYWNVNYNNRFRLDHYPVVSITSLSKNANAASQADSWTALTEQTGSSGDFIVDSNSGEITFVDEIPRYGARAIKVVYNYGYSAVPKQVERLCIFLAVEDLIRMRSNNAQFNEPSDVNVSELSVRNNASAVVAYLRDLREAIREAWEDVGIFDVALT